MFARESTTPALQKSIQKNRRAVQAIHRGRAQLKISLIVGRLNGCIPCFQMERSNHAEQPQTVRMTFSHKSYFLPLQQVSGLGGFNC